VAFQSKRSSTAFPSDSAEIRRRKLEDRALNSNGRDTQHKVPSKESDNVDRTYPHHYPRDFLLGGFSGRFGGYGYGHGGIGVIGIILVILVVLLLLGRL
jgi:Protein of unknown function (DUF3309)